MDELLFQFLSLISFSPLPLSTNPYTGECIQAIEESLKERQVLVPTEALGVAPSTSPFASSSSSSSTYSRGSSIGGGSFPPPPPPSSEEYDDFKKLLMPTGGEGRREGEGLSVEEAMRKVQAGEDLKGLPDIKPSFEWKEGAKDPIIVMEEKEKKALEEEEKKLKAKMRQVNLRLSQVGR